MMTVLIKSYKEKGFTAFVSSHDMEHLFSYADTLSVLSERGMTFYSDKDSFSIVRENVKTEAEKKVRDISVFRK